MTRYRVVISGAVELDASNEDSITVRDALSELYWASKPNAYIESVDEIEDAPAETREKP